MIPKKRLLWLVAVLIVVAVGASTAAMSFLYRTSLQEQRARLTDIARSQADLIESMALHGLEWNHDCTPERVFANVLHQIRDAHTESHGFAETGEFTLARLDGEKMIFLLNHRNDSIATPVPISFSSELAEPMRLALTSKTGGTVIGLDYRGELVLAAYEPVDILDLGIVAKIDLSEIRRPFVSAGILSTLSALLLIAVGAGLLWRIVDPIIEGLKDSSKKLADAQQIARLGYFDWDVKSETITWSEEGLRIHGLDPKHNPMTISEALATTHPDDVKAVNRALKAVLEGTADYDIEYRIVRTDGKAQFICARGQMTRARDGSPIRMLGTVIDITDRKLAEQAVNESRQLLQLVADHLPILIAYVDKDGKFLYANKEYRNWFGLTSEEIVGRSVREVLGEKGYHIVRDKLKTALSGTPVSFSGEMPVDDGSLRPFHASYIPHVTHDNTVAGMIVMVKDCTEQLEVDLQRSQMEKQLYQSEKMASIGQLSAGVAHEINNPVGYVSSNLNTMQKYVWAIERFVRQTDNPKTVNQESIYELLSDFGDAIAESLDGMDRVTRIVSDLKGFSRSDSNEIQSADINKGIESTLNIVWNQLKYTCTIDKDLGDLPQVECVAGQINQVVMILLINAGQAVGKPDGRIGIKTWHEPEYVFISVRDNGVGIPKKNLKHIFDPFFTTKEVGQGTGLGLSLAYDIINKHGGRIDVESEEGHGATFTVTLPVRTAASNASADSFVNNSDGSARVNPPAINTTEPMGV